MTRTIRLRWTPRTRLALAALALTPALLLSACSGTPGAAATVGSRTISESDLMATAAQIDAYQAKHGQQEVSVGDVLMVLVIADDAVAKASQTKAWVPDATFDQAMSTIADVTPMTRLAFEASAAMSSLSSADQAAVVKAVLQSGVTVNPRYGTFDSTSGLTHDEPNWISVPGAAATATPSASPTR